VSCEGEIVGVAGVVLSQNSGCRIFCGECRATCKAAHHQNNMRFLIIPVSEIVIGILK